MITDEHPFEFAPQQDEYTQLLTELHNEYCAEQPLDVLQFCSNFFIRKLEEQRLEHRNNHHSRNNLFDTNDTSNDLHPLCEQPQEDFSQQQGIQWETTHMGHPNDHGALHDDDDDPLEDEDDEEFDKFSTEPLPSLPPTNYNRGRRTSVKCREHGTQRQPRLCQGHHPQISGTSERIKVSISNNFLFRNLDEEQYLDVVNAMSEKRVVKGTTVIEQGSVGDFFYVVESGTLDCFIGQNKVTNYEAGGSFGELALMYNAPRAATIITTSDSVLWALDRNTSAPSLMENTSRKRRMYEYFLSEVVLLKSLESYEQHKIADALESVYFEDGQEVVKQGDVGDQFYIIESGEAIVLKEENGVQQQVNQLERGSYFGELALLNDAPRAATVVAHGRLKCATLGKKAFTRLLGPVLDILKRNSENYHAVINQQS
uniref:cAMP-dependent protein kinase regulatory subunit n=1 Tax=Mucor circinelloides f. lusitanicus TaxID=29924 RepID=KAPR_MUCCL|nr:RecName: Full=cAMP-dependent protein kinase regulatory subunit; Short=PKA regulatory subunit [Mucor lusitanicus]CAC81804.1 cAMP-dependent protein kinase A, regulatory subunit [Mucor racemosus]